MDLDDGVLSREDLGVARVAFLDLNNNFPELFCEPPRIEDGGGSTGVKEPAEEGGGPAGVVEGLDARKLEEPRLWVRLALLSGVEGIGGLEEKGTLNDDIGMPFTM